MDKNAARTLSTYEIVLEKEKYCSSRLDQTGPIPGWQKLKNNK